MQLKKQKLSLKQWIKRVGGKKGRVALLTFLLVGLLCFSGCEKENTKMKKVVLNEVAHSIFYAPQYVAIENGYFEEEGIDLELVTGFGADKVMSALVAGEADIGFAGAEASIYLYQEGANDYAVNFAQLTQRAGNFLVARQPMDDFDWDMIKGKEVLGGRKGGMPQMVLEYILKKNDIDPGKDVKMNQSIDFGSTAAAFSGGQGDYTVEFEPAATALEEASEGDVVASLGVDSGYIPYTSYCVTKKYMEENEDIVMKFTKAMQKGMEFVETHTPKEIAVVIQPQFEETDIQTIEKIVKRYYDQETWKDNLVFEQDSFELLQNILLDAGELKQQVPYEKLVNTQYATQAAEQK